MFLGGHFLFTFSDTFAVGCNMYSSLRMHSITDRQTDRQADGIIMPIADHTACMSSVLNNSSCTDKNTADLKQTKNQRINNVET